MSPPELDHSATDSVNEHTARVEAVQSQTPTYVRLFVVGLALVVVLLNLLAIAALIQKPSQDWVEIFAAGVITGFALGTVFGLWIGKNVGYDPKPKKFILATSIVVLNGCVGFFGFPYLTGRGFWPTDQQTFFYSIGTASTLVSGAMFCLVNFFWHSRDQKRIQTLRDVLNKTRTQIKVAQARADEAYGQAEQARREAEAERLRATGFEREFAEEAARRIELEKTNRQALEVAEQARREAEAERSRANRLEREIAEEAARRILEEKTKREALDVAEQAQEIARQAQRQAEREKRWRLNTSLLVGKWRCVEYQAIPNDMPAQGDIPRVKEKPSNMDVLTFFKDGRFLMSHPGDSKGGIWGQLATAFSAENIGNPDIAFEKDGHWSLDSSGQTILIQYTNGDRRNLQIRSLDKANLITEKRTDKAEILRFLVKIG